MIFILDHSSDDDFNYELSSREDCILLYNYEHKDYTGLPVVLNHRFDTVSTSAKWATVTGTRKNWHRVIKEINR